MIKEIKISEELAKKVQKAHVEEEGLLNLITFMKRSDVEDDIISEYYNKYIEAYRVFSEAKQEVTKIVGEYDNASWNLDYNTGIVTITENE